MSRSDSIGSPIPHPGSRVLVVQGGVHHMDTLDLLHELAPSRVEAVDDVYEAVALAVSI